jgi:hypothetical protein
MGYFEDMYHESYNGVRDDFDYMIFGVSILLSPIMLPIYYVGMLGRWVMGRGSDEADAN